MRWGSSVVPVHLVSFSLQPHTFFVPSCPLSHVFILLSLLRAHFLALVLFASPRGGVCVCVPLVVTGIPLNCFLLHRRGDCLTLNSGTPTKRLF